MTVSVLLIYMMLIKSIATVDYEQFVLDTYRQNCPYSHTCTKTSQSVFPKDMESYIPCCLPCSCEENCSETKSCCPDALNFSIAHDGDKNTECLTSSYHVDDRDHNGVNSILKRYNTIRTCPSTYQHKNTVSKCTRRFPKTFDEHVFVSDENGKIYRNRYCALCNSANIIKRWNILIQCTWLGQGFYNKQLTIKSIMESGCTIWSEEPRHIRLPVGSLCSLVEFDKCNMTGSLSVYDPNIDKACKSGEFGLFFSPRKFYKNIFCFMCNNDDHKNAPNMECPALDSKSTTDSFTAVIDYETVSGAYDPSARCKITELYDEYADKCRTLICPTNSVPTYGKCMGLFKATNGMMVEFALRLTAREHFPNNSYDLKNVFKSSIVAINGIIESQNENCRVCTLTVWTEPTNGYTTWVVQLVMATSSSCPESNILDIANNLDNRSIILNVTTSQSYAFDMHLILQKYAVSLGTDYFILFDSDMCNAEHVYILDLLCPRILISGTDYAKAMKKNNLIQTEHYLKFQLNKENQNQSKINFEICVDEYFVSSGSRSLRRIYYCTSNMEACVMNPTFLFLLYVIIMFDRVILVPDII